MYNVNVIAKRILILAKQENISISHLKLQKLLYFVQGWHLAYLKTGIFIEELEAWDHGPVIPSIFHACKAEGNMYAKIPLSIFLDIEDIEIAQKSDELLQHVWNAYKEKSGTTLEFITHSQGPWQESYKKGGSRNNFIFKENIANFFLKHYFK